MQILTIVSQKGGVGKTAIALNLGWALATEGQRVLIADTDPQSGLSRSIAAQLVKRSGIADVLQQSVSWTDCIVPTRRDGFALLPLGRVQPWESASFEHKLEDGNAFGALRDAIDDAYDILIIDTPAGLGNATMGAMRAADAVLSPVQAEPAALRAATAVLDTLRYLATQEDCTPNFLGYVLNMVNRSDRVSSAIVQEAWEVFPEDLLLETSIPRDPAFLEATSKGLPVGALTKNARRISLIFDQLALEVQTRMEARA